MHKLSRTALAAVLACWTLGAHAWWGPFSGWFEDFFGSGAGSFDFAVSLHGNGGGWGRYYDYRGPYGAPVRMAPPAQGYPYAAMPPVLSSNVGSDYQAGQLRRDVEAQRLLAERMAKRRQDDEKNRSVSTSDPFSGFDPFSMQPETVKKTEASGDSPVSPRSRVADTDNKGI